MFRWQQPGMLTLLRCFSKRTRQSAEKAMNAAVLLRLMACSKDRTRSWLSHHAIGGAAAGGDRSGRGARSGKRRHGEADMHGRRPLRRVPRGGVDRERAHPASAECEQGSGEGVRCNQPRSSCSRRGLSADAHPGTLPHTRLPLGEGGGWGWGVVGEGSEGEVRTRVEGPMLRSTCAAAGSDPADPPAGLRVAGAPLGSAAPCTRPAASATPPRSAARQQTQRCWRGNGKDDGQQRHCATSRCRQAAGGARARAVRTAAPAAPPPGHGHDNHARCRPGHTREWAAEEEEQHAAQNPPQGESRVATRRPTPAHSLSPAR